MKYVHARYCSPPGICVYDPRGGYLLHGGYFVSWAGVNFITRGLISWRHEIIRPDVRVTMGGDFDRGIFCCTTPAYPGCPGKDAVDWFLSVFMKSLHVKPVQVNNVQTDSDNRSLFVSASNYLFQKRPFMFWRTQKSASFSIFGTRDPEEIWH